MLRVVRTKIFERSFRRLKKSGLFKSGLRDEVNAVILQIAQGKSLPLAHHDHQLTGDMSAYRECHVRGDLLLVYERRDDILVLFLIDIGSHSQLFG